tara:strand:- start:617 stop:904 length:288 start_codon:yes stop_codon:yes gene_type:complete
LEELEFGLSKEGTIEFLFPSSDPEYSLFYAIILLIGSLCYIISVNCSVDRGYPYICSLSFESFAGLYCIKSFAGLLPSESAFWFMTMPYGCGTKI